MFYCETCRQKHKYPRTIFQSHGPCEVCGKTADCSDYPSGRLPGPGTHEEAQQVQMRILARLVLAGPGEDYEEWRLRTEELARRVLERNPG
jgi:hypothetical protein